MGRASYLRQPRYNGAIIPREVQPEFVPRTENEEARRAMVDWLRDRSEEDVPEFEDELDSRAV